MKRFIARLLCALLSLQGYPLLALQETGVRAVPDTRAVGLVEDWVSSAAHETSTWADSLRKTASEWVKSLEETASIAAFVADGAQGAGSSGGGASASGVSSSSEEGNERPRLQALEGTEKETTSRRPTPLEVSPRLRLVDKKARVEKAPIIDANARSSAIAPASTPRQVIPKAGVAPEISALAQSLGSSPGRILRFVHDEIDFDPKWGAGKSPLGTLLERQGTAWDQAWLLQQLFTAAGVDARFEWGEIEITPELLKNVTGVDDPFRAGDLLTTAGVPIVLLVDGSRVVAARMSHVWVKAFLDYIPNRGATPGPGDKWIRMDPSLKRFDVGVGVRLDEAVPFDLGEYLQSGTLLSPRSFYEEALQSYIDANNVGVAGLEELKPAKSLIQEAFPFVPASLRGKILTVAGESPDLPAAFQQQLDVQVREAGGAQLLTWSTPWLAVYGKRLELAWPGATSADQSALDLNGGVFATPPYEVDLRPVLRVDGAEVASGEAIGSAGDVELTATLTPPAGSPMVAQFEMFAGEHASLTVDFGRIPREVVDRLTAERDAATTPDEHEAWALALAGAVYLRSLNGDLEHVSALRYRRAVQLGNVVLAAQRGAASRAPDGTPLTFSAAPPSLDLGSMVLGLFPADGDTGPASTSVSSLELLGSQGSSREAEGLTQALGGNHLTTVGFLTRAAREGQTLTRVDATNVDTALAASELSSDAELSVRAGVERGLIAWISETHLPLDTWDATGYVLEDPATGAGGYFVTYERLVRGLEANIVFHSPQDIDVVTAPTDVVATLEGEEIASWTLSYRAADGGPAVELASGTGPFVNTTLAKFDPTLLLNGMHDIVLTARDAAGQMASQKISVAVDGQMKIGNFTLSFVDLAVPLSGLDIEVVRTYDSRDKAERDFGVSWTLDVRAGSYRNNRPPGDGWQIQSGFLPCDSVVESKSHLTTVRLSDEEIYRFALTLRDGAATGGGCFAEAGFAFVDGPLPGSTLEIPGNTSVFYENGANRVIDTETFDLYEPQQVRLTTRDGRIFELDLNAGVTKLEDLTGNTLDITEAEIIHSSGGSIAFERDVAGRITQVTDPRGNTLSYSYDPAGDLVAFTDQAANVTSFTYDSTHGLLEITDPLGSRAVRNEYDDSGRLVRATDSSGKTIELGHDLDASTEIVTNRLGQQRLLRYDARGNVTRVVDELGNVTTRAFDSRDNLLTETDPLGNTTEHTYDANNNLTSVTDPLGKTTSFTYNQRNQVLTTTDPRGKVTTNAYDSAGNLLSTTDAIGNETTFTYDGAGNLLTEIDALGNVSTFEYDSRGNLTKETDPLGHEITFTYDATGNRLSETRSRTLADGSTETLTTSYTHDDLGRLTSTTTPLGATTTTIYDALGHTVKTIDPLGRETSFTYDGLGRLLTTTDPDGKTQEQSFDAEGRLRTRIDRAERVTTFTYDAGGRLTETRSADGAVTTKAYDAAGRIVSSTDARNHTTTFEYDAAGRRTKITDGLGNETTFAHDAASNQTAITDARGNTTAFEYDDLNRLSRTVFPDGTARTIGHDALGRVTSETDQAGRTARFGYDALGHLTSVTDALGQITRYDYDELGNRTSQTDANGHTTAFAYDAVGRQTGRTLPAVGDPPLTVSESMAYDAVGNLVARTKFDGATITFAYDALNRLTKKTFPGGGEVHFSYTATGRRASVTDSRGTTSYSYDKRDRLIALTYPDDRALLYDYDAEGNRQALTAQIGDTSLTTTYTYDALNRLETVTDPDGRVYNHVYDANGNRAFIAYPNGVTTTYQYDDLDRLTNLTTLTSVGNVIQSYAYTLGPAGNRTAIVEHAGTTRSYSYDSLYRLTAEAVMDGGGVEVYTKSFDYDPEGNRVRQVTTGMGAGSVDYSYDEWDRLLLEDGQSYSWDANGNLTGKSGKASYRWDAEDRLAVVSLDDGTVTVHTYDTDGVRMRTEVTAPDGTVTITDFLVDTSGPVSQVVAETDEAGYLDAYYVRGDDLLAVVRPIEGTRFYHADGLGSIRELTDEAGEVTDRYTFSAFGELLEHAGEDPQAYLFSSEQLEPNSGFYHFRARWMDPGTGRFASADPWMGDLYDPISLHKYLYAGTDPANKHDPTGLSYAINVVVVGAIIGMLAAYTVFQPQGPIETTTYLLGGAIAGAAIAGILLWWAGVGLAAGAATGAAAVGTGSVPLVNAAVLRLPPAGPERIWLGNYGGRGYILDGVRITGVADLGLVWLQRMANRYGGEVLNRLSPTWPAIQARIDSARQIVFNISRIPPNSFTRMEYEYIRSSPELMRKTIWVTNASY